MDLASGLISEPWSPLSERFKLYFPECAGCMQVRRCLDFAKGLFRRAVL